MLNQPFAITAAEFQEITRSPELQEIWGVEGSVELTEVLKLTISLNSISLAKMLFTLANSL